MDMQNVAKLNIPEGDVRTIHDKDGNLIWGKVSYGVKYKGDTAQNGTPTPDTPVAVQTVTGGQTISIDGAAHTVNLGSLELCKIGTYQDYIYKSGDKWYVHKEIGKTTLDGSPDESIVRGATATSGKVRFNVTVSGVANISGSEAASYSDNFVGVTRNDTWNCVQGVAIGQNLVQIYYEATSGYDLDQFRAWLGSHNTTVYYALAAPTDTEITNATLVGQLEAVEQWLTRYGYNATVSGNLPIIIDRTAL